MLLINKKNNVNITVASNPEFLAQGTAVRDTLYASRIVIGVENEFAKDTLTKEMLQEFAQESRKTNLASKISFFERTESKDNYKYFGPYYLALAKAYYENEQYRECLEAIENYEENNVQIFRKDYEYAKLLPLVIVSAQKVHPQNYEDYVDKYLFDSNIEDDINLTIKGNSKETDWEIRYFVAHTFVKK